MNTVEGVALAVAEHGLVPALIVLAVLRGPVVVATLVFTWHSLRGTSVGPGGEKLLALARLTSRRRGGS